MILLGIFGDGKSERRKKMNAKSKQEKDKVSFPIPNESFETANVLRNETSSDARSLVLPFVLFTFFLPLVICINELAICGFTSTEERFLGRAQFCS